MRPEWPAAHVQLPPLFVLLNLCALIINIPLCPFSFCTHMEVPTVEEVRLNNSMTWYIGHVPRLAEVLYWCEARACLGVSCACKKLSKVRLPCDGRKCGILRAEPAGTKKRLDCTTCAGCVARETFHLPDSAPPVYPRIGTVYLQPPRTTIGAFLATVRQVGRYLCLKPHSPLTDWGKRAQSELLRPEASTAIRARERNRSSWSET